jgi:hypothetical protein
MCWDKCRISYDTALNLHNIVILERFLPVLRLRLGAYGTDRAVEALFSSEIVSKSQPRD